MVAMPFWTNLSSMSLIATSYPVCANTCAMPAPIVPAPKTPTFLISKDVTGRGKRPELFQGFSLRRGM